MLRCATVADIPVLKSWMAGDYSAQEWVGDEAWIDEVFDGALVFEIDGRPAAVASVEFLGRDGSISLVVDPARRGQGTGTRTIRALFARYCPDFTLWAEISWRNSASEAAFSKAGFFEFKRDRHIRHSHWISPPY